MLRRELEDVPAEGKVMTTVLTKAKDEAKPPIISAIILVKAGKRKPLEQVTNAIKDKLSFLMQPILFEVLGPYDIGIMIPSVINIELLSKKIVDKIREVDGVVDTVTMITDPDIPELLTHLTASADALAREIERLNLPAFASAFRDYSRYLYNVLLEFNCKLDRMVGKKDFWIGIIVLLIPLLISAIKIWLS